MYIRIQTESNCKADPNQGFIFSSWSEYVGKNASKTITKSPDSLFTNFINLIGLDTSSNLVVNKYGTFVANFTQSPIPQGVWISLFGIMLGTFMPSIIRWLNGLRQRSNLHKHVKEIHTNKDNLDEHTRRAKIMELYAKGKVNDAQYRILEDKVSEYYKKSSSL